MKKINFRSISNPLSNTEMKLVSGGNGNICITCTTDPDGNGYQINGIFNDCYFHFCHGSEGVRCEPC